MTPELQDIVGKPVIRIVSTNRKYAASLGKALGRKGFAVHTHSAIEEIIGNPGEDKQETIDLGDERVMDILLLDLPKGKAYDAIHNIRVLEGRIAQQDAVPVCFFTPDDSEISGIEVLDTAVHPIQRSRRMPIKGGQLSSIEDTISKALRLNMPYLESRVCILDDLDRETMYGLIFRAMNPFGHYEVPTPSEIDEFRQHFYDQIEFGREAMVELIEVFEEKFWFGGDPWSTPVENNFELLKRYINSMPKSMLVRLESTNQPAYRYVQDLRHLIRKWPVHKGNHERINRLINAEGKKFLMDLHKIDSNQRYLKLIQERIKMPYRAIEKIARIIAVEGAERGSKALSVYHVDKLTRMCCESADYFGMLLVTPTESRLADLPNKVIEILNERAIPYDYHDDTQDPRKSHIRMRLTPAYPIRIELQLAAYQPKLILTEIYGKHSRSAYDAERARPLKGRARKMEDELKARATRIIMG